jgi:hypothetical protein
MALLLGTMVVMVFGIEFKLRWAHGAQFALNTTRTMPEGDFANLWAAGKLAASGRTDTLYSSYLFELWRRADFGARIITTDWIYPPFTLLLAVPMSWMGLRTGYIVWTLLSILGSAFLLRLVRLSWPVILLGIFSPASIYCIMLGQYGTLVGAAFVASLLAAPRRPLLSGGLTGIMILKPQIALLIPIVWLAQRNARAIAMACAITAVLAALVTLSFGPSVWSNFWANAPANSRGILEDIYPQGYQTIGVSIFWMARSLGSNLAVAYTAQIISAGLATIMVWHVWRMPSVNPVARMAITVFLTLLCDPYGYVIDMFGYSIALVCLAEQRSWRIGFLDVVLFTWPGLCLLTTSLIHILLTPILLLYAAMMALRLLQPPLRLVDTTGIKAVLKWHNPV